MKQEALEKMKRLNTFAKSIGGFWEAYKRTTAKSSCDKYEAKFNGDSRFTVFKVKQAIQFNALHGYYGNSGCTTFGGSVDDDLATTYFLKALNIVKRDIFEEMAKLAKADAAKLSEEASKELEALQQMVASANEAA